MGAFGLQTDDPNLAIREKEEKERWKEGKKEKEKKRWEEEEM